MYDSSNNGSRIPLQDILFEASIKDCLSTVQITQRYINNSSTAIESEYLFPVDSLTMAVTGLTITIDGKCIEAKVMEKTKAEEKYSDAVAGGHTAVKVDYDEKRPDIVRMHVGNLLPGKSVVVVTKYVKLLEVEDSSWSFRVPVTYTHV